MTQGKLEKIVSRAGTAVKGTVITTVVVGTLGATVGALGAGVYEGYTGQKIFGPETSAVELAVGVAYGTQILTALIPDKREKMDHDAIAVALVFPIGPMISIALYATGSGIGYLLK